MTHRQLSKQLKKLDADPKSPPDLETWEQFLTEVEKAYVAADHKHGELEQCLADTSQEMQDMFQDLKHTSEARYRSIFEGVQDAIVVVKHDGSIVDINTRASEMYGWSREDFIKKTLFDLSIPENKKSLEPILDQDHPLENPIEVMNIRSDGEVFPVEINARFHNINGNDVVLAVVRDITERRKAEKQLEEEALEHAAASVIRSSLDYTDVINKITEQMGQAVGATSACICTFNPKNHSSTVLAKFVSPSANEKERVSNIGENCQMGDDFPYDVRGISSGRVLNYHLADESLSAANRSYLNDHGAQAILVIPLQIQGRTIASVELWDTSGKREFTRDEIALCQSIGQHAAAAIENARLYTEVQRELSEKKLAELALRESEEKFRTLAEKSPNMIFINQAGKIIYANPECERRMGFSREEFYSPEFDFLSLISEDHIATIKKNLELHQRGEEVPPYESILITKDGQELHAIHATRLMTYNGDPAILGIVTDVTDRKVAEQEQAKRAIELSILSEIGGKIAAVLDLNDLLDRTVQLVHEKFNYEHVAIFLLDVENNSLEMRARSGVYVDAFPEYHTIKLGEGIVGWVGKTGASLLVNNVVDDKRYINFYPKAIQSQSELSIPIIVGEKILGVLDIQSQEPNAFDQHDQIVMDTLVDQIAAAIENARLYEEIQQELLERQKVVDALSESESNYRSIFEGVHDAIIVESMNGEVLDVNERACELFGFKREDFLNMHISDLFPTGSFKVLPDDLEQDELPEKSFETINARADGTHFPVEISARLHHIGGEQVMLVVVRDITERKHAEEELIRSEERLRIIYENAPDAYYLTDLKGEFIDGNGAAEKIIGYPKEELIGKSFLEVGLLQKKDIPRAAKLLGRNVVGQRTGPDVFDLKRRDGDRVSVEISTFPVKIENQTLVLGIARDISGRIKAEAAVRESEERFRSIAETAADAIVFMDHAGYVRYWNKAAKYIFGYTSDEVIGKKVDLIIQEEDLEIKQAEGPKEELSGNGRELGKTIELTGRRKNGEEFPIELSLATWKTRDGEFTSAIIRDVTAARNAQKRAKLQDRLAAVGQLAAGIAHDFNNILGTIILYSELMLNSNDLDPKERERLDTIFNQAQRGAKLTAQILDFGRKSVMERHVLDLVPFFKDLENLLSRTLPENVKLTFSYNDEEHYYINADPTRMQQVVMNLALNARDAMPEGGDLIFDISQFEVITGSAPFRDMPAGPWVRIRVSDTGVGIPPDVMPHIFEPFFTTKPQGRGTGLGLAQVYGIVKQHEGYIDADSQEMLGSMFTIYCPAMTDVVLSEHVIEYESIIGGTGETILVVEDDEATRKAICEILESMGYQLLNVGDGEEALEVIKDENAHIKLIISDLVMPNMGGRDLYDAVESSYPEIKMILMTGYPLGSHTRELLDRRRVIWLQKPLTSESLSKAVLQMLEKAV